MLAATTTPSIPAISERIADLLSNLRSEGSKALASERAA
jgi:hypothetical protein